MESKHALFLTIGLVLFVLAVGLEVGEGLLPQGRGVETCLTNPRGSAACQALLETEGTDAQRMRGYVALADPEKPPGYGIKYLAMLDIVLLATIGLIAAHLWLAPAILSRVQGVVMLVSGLVVFCWSMNGILMVLALLLLMIGLFLAPPFGTAFYMATYGFFDVGSATAVLTLVMLLKLGFCVCLILAHNRYLRIKSLVAMAGCSLLTTFIVGFLHDLAPIPLVSITDAIGAIVVAIVGLLWAVYAIVGGAKGVFKAIV